MGFHGCLKRRLPFIMSSVEIRVLSHVSAMTYAHVGYITPVV